MSVKTNNEIFTTLSFLPQNPTVDNYRMILGDPDWYMGYVNAAIYVLMNVVISVAVAMPAAYAFSRYRFAGDRLLFFGFLAFRMMAPAILLVPFVQIFSDLNLIDTHIAVALAHCFFNVPIAIWILEGFITAIPREMDESARVDGYSPFRYFRRILLPLIAPGIARDRLLLLHVLLDRDAAVQRTDRGRCQAHRRNHEPGRQCRLSAMSPCSPPPAC